MRKYQHFLLRFRKLLKNRKFVLVYLPFFLVIFALPLVIIVLQKKQQTNQYASAASNDLYVSTSGNDSNPCTQASPCLTINHVSALATPGTTVHVMPGTYNFNASEPIRTATSGTASAPITYVSDSKWGAKLVNSWYQAGGGATWYNTASYIVIKGFEISGGGGIDGLIDFGSHNTISGNYVHDMNNDTSVLTCLQLGSGGIFLGGDGTTVSGNVVRHIGPPGIDTCITTHGFYISSGSSNVIVNNIASNNSGFGIHCWGPSSVTVANNVSFNNGTGGMIFGNGNGTFDNSIISNNIVINNGVWGIRELENTGTHEIGPNNQILNNMVYGNPNGDMLLIEGNTDSGRVTTDAQFINYQADGSGDYHLKSTSPAIDSGTITGAPATDFDSNTRPQGAGFDIGAYEYVAAVTPTPTGGAACLASTTSWQNQAISSQTGSFEVAFDATPNMNGEASVIGLSQNSAAAYTDLASIVAFETTGVIDARNGSTYQAQTTVTYSAGKMYHFRLDINVPNHNYSIYVTPPSSSELSLGTNYAFRTEQAGATNLNYWSTVSISGSVNVCNFGISPLVAPTITPTPTPVPPTPTFTPIPTPTNTPVPTTTPTPKPTNTPIPTPTPGMLSLNSLAVFDTNSSYWHLMTNLQTGKNQWGDRGYYFTSIPSSLAGASWVQTAMGSKTSSNNPLAAFTISRSATVYVALDTRNPIPNFMSSWSLTSLTIKDSANLTFKLYAKSFVVGTSPLQIVLGPEAVSFNGHSMYTVIVK
jgi:parallel beta-helix repeat protein